MAVEFIDDFNRGVSDTVGNGWTEFGENTDTGEVSLDNGDEGQELRCQWSSGA